MQNANANATAILLNNVEGRCMWIAAEKQNKNTKKKTKKKMENKKKGNLFLNRSQVWRASKTARGCKKKCFLWQGRKKLKGRLRGKNAWQMEAEKWKKRVLQRGASRSRSGERSEPKLRQGCSVAAMKKKQLRNSSDCDGDSDCDDDNDGTKGTIARNDENWQQTNDGCSAAEWVRFGAICVPLCVCVCVLWVGVCLRGVGQGYWSVSIRLAAGS